MKVLPISMMNYGVRNCKLKENDDTKKELRETPQAEDKSQTNFRGLFDNEETKPATSVNQNDGETEQTKPSFCVIG